MYRFMQEPDVLHWYPLRVTYSRELKVRGILQTAGYECFVPMVFRTEVRDGVESRKTVPAVNNLCFVKAVRGELDLVREKNGLKSYTSYIWDRVTRMPLTVPDKAMDDFIRVSETMRDDVLYLHEINPKLRQGQKVRIKEGPFAGVEGRVVRVRKSRRVMVELPGIFAVATGYVPEDKLEIINTTIC